MSKKMHKETAPFDRVFVVTELIVSRTQVFNCRIHHNNTTEKVIISIVCYILKCNLFFIQSQMIFFVLTRMHSSRMRTTRLRIVPGGVLSTWSEGEGGRCCDLVPSGPPPPRVGQTNACENITFATRAVIDNTFGTTTWTTKYHPNCVLNVKYDSPWVLSIKTLLLVNNQEYLGH